MTSNMFKKVALQPWIPRVQSIRLSSRVNIQKPKPPHFLKSKMLKVTQPTYPKPPPGVINICDKYAQKNELEIDNPYERILAKELMNWVDKSQAIFLFQDLFMNGEERYDSFAILKRKGIHMQRIGKQVAGRAFNGTKYEVILPLFVLHVSIAFAENASSVKTLLGLRKKLRHHVVVAGIVEDRLMTVGQMERYAALPDLTMSRLQLVSILNGVSSPACRLVSQLNTHQQNLVTNLESRLEQLKTE